MATATSENHHREHAEHNEEVYNFLRQDLNYIDWVITCAYYSALHYVEYKIFPRKFTLGGEEHEFNSIEDYHSFCGAKNIHASRKRAIRTFLSDCRRPYEQLFDLCMTARYRQYKFDNPKDIDLNVERWLQNVKKNCI